MRPELSSLQLPLPIAIVGLGLSGLAAKNLLLTLGLDSSQILTFDEKSPADFQNHEDLLKFGKPKTFCVSPGVPLQQSWIQSALADGVQLTSELELAFACLQNEQVIAITGSVGKSTTTSILGAGARAIDLGSFTGGNLGVPLADYSREILEGKRSRAQWLVLELSSYQLENFKNLKSKVSILTHLSPNHLERYHSLAHYYQTKLELFRHTTEFAILNRSGGHIASMIDPIQKTNPKIKWTWTDRNDPIVKKMMTEKPALVGSHNLDNLAMAFTAAHYLQWPSQAYEAMLRFPGLPHRLENCGWHQGILFLNDSKATAIDSVLQAVQSVRQEFPKSEIHLLLGGKDKNLPWEEIASLGRQLGMRFYFFGEVGSKAQTESGLSGPVHSKLAQCLAHVRSQLNSGDIVLFSPGGTSLDEFKNFEERGQYFKNWISSEFQNDHA